MSLHVYVKPPFECFCFDFVALFSFQIKPKGEGNHLNFARVDFLGRTKQRNSLGMQIYQSCFGCRDSRLGSVDVASAGQNDAFRDDILTRLE